MSRTKLVANLFRVCRGEDSPHLEVLLTELREKDQPFRVRTVNQREVYLEIIKPPDNDHSTWRLEFTSRGRANPPTRSHPERPSEGIPFENGTQPGYQTAAIYDPELRCMAVEYNHNGLRSGGIAAYLSMVQGPEYSYSLDVCLDLAAAAKLASAGQVRKVAVGIDLHRLSRDQYDAGSALGQCIDAGATVGAASIKIEIGIEPVPGFMRRGLNTLLQPLQGLLSSTDAVTSAKAVVGDDEEAPSFELVDLVHHKLSAVFDVAPDILDLRVPVEKRWALLQKAYGSQPWQQVANSV